MSISPRPEPPTVQRSWTTISPRHKGRWDLAVFLGLVVLLSAPLEIAIGRTEALRDPSGVLLVASLMWMPALASVLTRLATRRGFGDLSLRRTPHLPQLLWWPLLIGLPAYAVALGVGVVHLDLPAAGPWVALVVAAVLVNLILVPGEEIGWRGLMVPLIVEAGIPAPLLTSGAIWGLWHVPLVLWGGFVDHGPAPWISAVVLVVVATALGQRLGALRLETGSTLPPIVLHAAWNVSFQAILEVSVAGRHEGLWLGEAGLLTCLSLVVVVSARHSLAPVARGSVVGGRRGDVR